MSPGASNDVLEERIRHVTEEMRQNNERLTERVRHLEDRERAQLKWGIGTLSMLLLALGSATLWFFKDKLGW